MADGRLTDVGVYEARAPGTAKPREKKKPRRVAPASVRVFNLTDYCTAVR